MNACHTGREVTLSNAYCGILARYLRQCRCRFRLTMVFESLVSDLLNRFIGDYVENLDKSQLKIGIWGGKRTVFVKQPVNNRDACLILCCKTSYADMQCKLGVNVLQCPLMSLVFDWFPSCYIGSLSICLHGGDKKKHYLYGLLSLFIEFPPCYVLFISVINIIQAY